MVTDFQTNLDVLFNSILVMEPQDARRHYDDNITLYNKGEILKKYSPEETGIVRLVITNVPYDASSEEIIKSFNAANRLIGSSFARVIFNYLHSIKSNIQVIAFFIDMAYSNGEMLLKKSPDLETIVKAGYQIVYYEGDSCDNDIIKSEYMKYNVINEDNKVYLSICFDGKPFNEYYARYDLITNISELYHSISNLLESLHIFELNNDVIEMLGMGVLNPPEGCSVPKNIDKLVRFYNEYDMNVLVSFAQQGEWHDSDMKMIEYYTMSCDVIRIWYDTLSYYGVQPVMRSMFSNNSFEDNEKLVRFGKLAGIESKIQALIKGVSLDDLLFNEKDR